MFGEMFITLARVFCHILCKKTAFTVSLHNPILSKLDNLHTIIPNYWKLHICYSLFSNASD